MAPGSDARSADLDSEGVYYLSVEDFEWRPPRSSGEEPGALGAKGDSGAPTGGDKHPDSPQGGADPQHANRTR